MEYVDVHAHLKSSQFKNDLDEVVARAEAAGVKWIFNSGTTPKRNRESLELAKRFGIVKASFGLYPVGNLSKDVDKELDWIREHKDNVVAIGECGFDFKEEAKENFDRQKELFVKQIRLARELGKPVVVHSRKGELEAVETLEEEKADKVVMHCFHGSKKLIKRCVDNGWSFSVPPNITRLDHFKMLVEIVSLEQLLTETDSPYLAPKVGERNEPANVVVTVAEIAKIKGLGEEEVAKKIFENTRKLFNL